MRDSGLTTAERLHLQTAARNLTRAALNRVEAEREHERACEAYVAAITAVHHHEIERKSAGTWDEPVRKGDEVAIPAAVEV